MVNVTFSVPERIHKIMKEYSEIKWTEIARKAILKKALEIKMQKDPLRAYTTKRLIEEGEDAGDLFEL